MIQLIQLSEKELQSIVNLAVDQSFEKHKTNFRQPPTTEWLTRKQTIKLLSVSYVTLNTWSKAGVLTAYKIGNLVRYKRADVESALQKM